MVKQTNSKAVALDRGGNHVRTEAGWPSFRGLHRNRIRSFSGSHPATWCDAPRVNDRQPYDCPLAVVQAGQSLNRIPAVGCHTASFCLGTQQSQLDSANHRGASLPPRRSTVNNYTRHGLPPITNFSTDISFPTPVVLGSVHHRSTQQLTVSYLPTLPRF